MTNYIKSGNNNKKCNNECTIKYTCIKLTLKIV